MMPNFQGGINAENDILLTLFYTFYRLQYWSPDSRA